MVIDKDIEALWNQLFMYWQEKKPNIMLKPCSSATEEEITQLEKDLGLKLPKTFLDSFRMCNESVMKNENGEWFQWFGENRYKINNIDSDWDDVNIVYQQQLEYDESWDKKWIPFYDWNVNYLAILDMNDDENGNQGVVYCYDLERGDMVRWADNYTEWLKMAVAEVIEYGELRCKTIEKVLNAKWS